MSIGLWVVNTFVSAKEYKEHKPQVGDDNHQHFIINMSTSKTVDDVIDQLYLLKENITDSNPSDVEDQWNTDDTTVDCTVDQDRKNYDIYGCIDQCTVCAERAKKHIMENLKYSPNALQGAIGSLKDLPVDENLIDNDQDIEENLIDDDQEDQDDVYDEKCEINNKVVEETKKNLVYGSAKALRAHVRGLNHVTTDIVLNNPTNHQYYYETPLIYGVLYDINSSRTSPNDPMSLTTFDATQNTPLHCLTYCHVEKLNNVFNAQMLYMNHKKCLFLIHNGKVVTQITNPLYQDTISNVYLYKKNLYVYFPTKKVVINVTGYAYMDETGQCYYKRNNKPMIAQGQYYKDGDKIYQELPGNLYIRLSIKGIYGLDRNDWDVMTEYKPIIPLSGKPCLYDYNKPMVESSPDQPCAYDHNKPMVESSSGQRERKSDTSKILQKMESSISKKYIDDLRWYYPTIEPRNTKLLDPAIKLVVIRTKLSTPEYDIPITYTTFDTMSSGSVCDVITPNKTSNIGHPLSNVISLESSGIYEKTITFMEDEAELLEKDPIADIKLEVDPEEIQAASMSQDESKSTIEEESLENSIDPGDDSDDNLSPQREVTCTRTTKIENGVETKMTTLTRIKNGLVTKEMTQTISEPGQITRIMIGTRTHNGKVSYESVTKVTSEAVIYLDAKPTSLTCLLTDPVSITNNQYTTINTSGDGCMRAYTTLTMTEPELGFVIKETTTSELQTGLVTVSMDKTTSGPGIVLKDTSIVRVREDCITKKHIHKTKSSSDEIWIPTPSPSSSTTNNTELTPIYTNYKISYKSGEEDQTEVESSTHVIKDGRKSAESINDDFETYLKSSKTDPTRTKKPCNKPAISEHQKDSKQYDLEVNNGDFQVKHKKETLLNIKGNRKSLYNDRKKTPTPVRYGMGNKEDACNTPSNAAFICYNPYRNNVNHNQLPDIVVDNLVIKDKFYFQFDTNGEVIRDDRIYENDIPENTILEWVLTPGDFWLNDDSELNNLNSKEQNRSEISTETISPVSLIDRSHTIANKFSVSSLSSISEDLDEFNIERKQKTMRLTENYGSKPSMNHKDHSHASNNYDTPARQSSNLNFEDRQQLSWIQGDRLVKDPNYKYNDKNHQNTIYHTTKDIIIKRNNQFDNSTKGISIIGEDGGILDDHDHGVRTNEASGQSPKLNDLLTNKLLHKPIDSDFGAFSDYRGNENNENPQGGNTQHKPERSKDQGGSSYRLLDHRKVGEVNIDMERDGDYKVHEIDDIGLNISEHELNEDDYGAREDGSGHRHKHRHGTEAGHGTHGAGHRHRHGTHRPGYKTHGNGDKARRGKNEDRIHGNCDRTYGDEPGHDAYGGRALRGAYGSGAGHEHEHGIHGSGYGNENRAQGDKTGHGAYGDRAWRGAYRRGARHEHGAHGSGYGNGDRAHVDKAGHEVYGNRAGHGEYGDRAWRGAYGSGAGHEHETRGSGYGNGDGVHVDKAGHEVYGNRAGHGGYGDRAWRGTYGSGAGHEHETHGSRYGNGDGDKAGFGDVDRTYGDGDIDGIQRDGAGQGDADGIQRDGAGQGDADGIQGDRQNYRMCSRCGHHHEQRSARTYRCHNPKHHRRHLREWIEHIRSTLMNNRWKKANQEVLIYIADMIGKMDSVNEQKIVLNLDKYLSNPDVGLDENQDMESGDIELEKGFYAKMKGLSV